MNKKWTVIYYEANDGKCPVADFIDSGSKRNQAKVLRYTMKTFRKHLNSKLKDREFKQLYDEEREMLEIAIQLLETRKHMGLSQQELAKRAQITQQQLSRIESGMNCNMLTFLKVCHALQVKLDLSNIEAAQRNTGISLTI